MKDFSLAKMLRPEAVTGGGLCLPRAEIEASVIEIERHQAVSRVLRTDEDQAFSFAGREYLIEIYNEQPRRGGILASRQAEKTTYLRNDMIIDVMEHENDSILYAASSQPVVFNYSRNKFNLQFRYVEELRNEYIDKHCTQNMYERSFTTGSRVFFRAVGQTPESARSVTARKVVFDEVQSIQKDNIPVVEEVAHHFSKEGTSMFRYTGTPLTEDNHLSKYWYNSQQVEWIIHCSHCNKYQEPLGLDHVHPDRPFLFCQYCHKEIQSSHGLWVPMNPRGEYKMHRICRLMTPNCTWETMANDGVLDRMKNYSTQRFMNETLGLIYGSAGRPAPMSLLLKHCHEYVNTSDNGNQYWNSQNLVGALDWAVEGEDADADSYTLFSIFAFVNNKIRPVYWKRYAGVDAGDPERILEDIAQTANRFPSLRILGADYGAGHMENIRLSRMINAKLVEYFYTGSTEYPEWNPKHGRFYVNRSHSLEQCFILLRNGTFEFPPEAESRTFLQDIANEYQEAYYTSGSERVRYDHSDPDDFLHVLNYGKMTMEMVLGRRFLETGF